MRPFPRGGQQVAQTICFYMKMLHEPASRSHPATRFFAMKNRPTRVLSLALLVALAVAVAACKQSEEAIAPQPATEPGPATQAVLATASVVGVDLGTAVDVNKKVTAPKTSFGPKDTIVAAITARSSDPAASVRSKLNVRWTQLSNGQVINEEGQDVTVAGDATVNFRVATPEGWQPGKYKLEVLLDNSVVQSREYEIR